MLPQTSLFYFGQANFPECFHNLDESRSNSVFYVTAVAKPCGPHGLPNTAQKRAFWQGAQPVAQSGPDGRRRCSAADLTILTAPLHSTRARKIAKRPLSRVFTCQRGPWQETRPLRLPLLDSAGSSLCFHYTWEGSPSMDDERLHAGGSGSSGCHLPTGNLALRF